MTASYPGANAQTVRDTVAAPIEEQVSGVEGMMYMSSQCTNDGALHADGHVQARHRLGHGPGAGAEPRRRWPLPVLPDLVQATGITVKKKSPNTLMIVNLISPDEQPRQPLPEQLRHDLHQGRAGPAAGRRRHHLSRPARLQHARLARSGQAGGAAT